MELESWILSLQQGNQEANNQLIALKENPDSIQMFLACLKSTQNPIVKHFCVVIIRSIFSKNIHAFPIQFQEILMNEYFALIQHEQNMTIRNNMAEFLSLLNPSPENGLISKIIDFSNSLLITENPVFVATGLLIFRNLNIFLPEFSELLVHLSSIAFRFIQTDDFECRYQALAVLNSIIISDVDTPLQNEPEFPKVLLSLSQKVNNQPVDPKEASEIFTALSCALQSEYPLFFEYIPVIANYFAVLLRNTNVDYSIRISATDSALDLIKVGFEAIGPEIVKLLLDNLVIFSIEMATAFPESEDYAFVENLVDSLDTCLEQSDIFNIFYPMVQNLFNPANIMESRVSLTILSSLVSLDEECTLENMDTILQFLHSGLKSEDPFIPTASAKVINKLCSDIQDNIDMYIDDLLPLLFSRLNMLDCIDAASRLIDTCQELPEDYMNYINCIITIIPSNPNLVDRLVELLISFIDKIEFINEDLFDLLNPLITNFSNYDNLKANAVSFFGSLIKVCPNKTVSLINHYAQIACSLITETGYKENTQILQFFDNVVANQAPEIKAHISNILQITLQIININPQHERIMCEIKAKNQRSTANHGNEIENEEDEDEDDLYSYVSSIYVEMIQTAAFLLGDICKNFTADVGPHLTNIVTFIQNKMSDIYSGPTVFIRILDQISEAFIALNADISPILTILTDMIAVGKDLDEDSISAIWETMSLIMSNGGKPLVERYAPEITTNLLAIFSQKKNFYLDKRNSYDFKKQYRAPLFQTLNTFIDEMGEDSLQYVQPFMPFLCRMNDTPTLKSNSDAALTLAKIGTILPPSPDSDKILEASMLSSLNNITGKKANHNIANAFSTLLCIMNARPALLEPHIQNLIQGCNQIVQQVIAGQQVSQTVVNSAVTLWLLISQITNMQNATIENLTNALDVSHFDIDMPDLVIVANFVAFCSQNPQVFENLKGYFIQIASYVFASSQSLIKKIPANALNILIGLLKSNSNEDILVLLQFNRTLMMRIENNICLLQGGTQQ
ncbi:hypothetical protein TRFO_31301 [Tritrichomonas foetus]|uniref:Importin N-terminal domain-containing protein n=1 Tax=Tritrichomonas foetus TaxID=1144522 RepID=A0A1J4JRK0_9EUKA|nr:hypothetical protein TRFO_31301 [Tritrichomonas foetus]|eukprot:OHT01745.1 hypothetical protein TRFO_31301 [Tritrichomonas foetus]